MSNGSTDATRAASDEGGLPRQVDRQLSPPVTKPAPWTGYVLSRVIH
jgi:hypothetical protein